ncbi:MAG: fimbria/pilus periplasmic chaperone [Myxococcota bacterium]|nr:fimbria/pilus periplasmic chaperone [Myxococcota bacterium]
MTSPVELADALDPPTRLPGIAFMTRSHLVKWFVALGALVLFSAEGRARAASFQVNPVNLTLSTTVSNGLLSIRNQGDEPVRVQASVFTWGQRSNGEMDLTPTGDIVFFPSIVSLAPHEARNLRVAVASEAILMNAVVEQNYRLIVEELLPVVKASMPNAVRVITKMSIPVFVQASPAKGVPRIENLALRGRNVAFQLTNVGTTHFVAHKVRLFVTGQDGGTLLDQSIDGWYVLAHGARAYDLEMPVAACARGARIHVEANTDHGVVTQQIDSTCSP